MEQYLRNQRIAQLNAGKVLQNQEAQEERLYRSQHEQLEAQKQSISENSNRTPK